MLFDCLIDTLIALIMNLRHLQSFVMLAETLHFGEAARRLHMTQPPLSRQIAALEAALGVQLFTRHSRSVVLTPAGSNFYHNALRLLDDYDFAVRSARATARGESGELRIGFTMCAAWSVLPDLLAEFREAQPEVTLKLTETLPKDLQTSLLRGEVDIGISFPLPPGSASALHFRRLFSEPLCAVLPQQHRLAGRERVSAGELAEEAFVTFPHSTAPELHEAVSSCCLHYRFEPDIRLETNLQQTIVNLVAKGLGVSLVPQSMSRMQLEGAVFRPLEYSPAVEQGVFWNADNPNPCLPLFLHTAAACSW